MRQTRPSGVRVCDRIWTSAPDDRLAGRVDHPAGEHDGVRRVKTSLTGLSAPARADCGSAVARPFDSAVSRRSASGSSPSSRNVPLGSVRAATDWRIVFFPPQEARTRAPARTWPVSSTTVPRARRPATSSVGGSVNAVAPAGSRWKASGASDGMKYGLGVV